jgi:1-acyl-sn-glycerol-3-phosphate acyltransferase
VPPSHQGQAQRNQFSQGKSMTDTSKVPQPNLLLMRLLYTVFGPLFRVYFRLTFKRDTQRLDDLAAQHRPVVVIFNHTSHLDVPLSGLAVGFKLMSRVTLAGKQELLDSWKTRWLMHVMGVIPLKRDTTDTYAARVLLRALLAGRNILLAPEGTRSLDGQVHPFHVGFAWLAHRANALILPVGIRGADRALPKGLPLPRPRKITVAVGDPIDPQQFLTDKADDAAYNDFAEMVRQRIVALVTE